MQSHLPILSVSVIPLKTNGLPSSQGNSVMPPACLPPQNCRPFLTATLPAPPRSILSGMKPALLALALLPAFLPGITATQQPTQPASQNSSGSAHDSHAKMNERGEQGMGFSQTTSTHHFFLKSDGGEIQVEANDPKDTAARDSIRAHLTHITHAFSQGDFDIPMFVHDTTPPGVPEMKRMKDKITYTFKETPSGARVLLTTSDPEALAAIHKFLRFQIQEHQTHDPTTVQ